jgi:hypothetical protein
VAPVPEIMETPSYAIVFLITISFGPIWKLINQVTSPYICMMHNFLEVRYKDGFILIHSQYIKRRKELTQATNSGVSYSSHSQTSIFVRGSEEKGLQKSLPRQS